MKYKNNAAKNFKSARTESVINSGRKISSTVRKQKSSSSEYSNSGTEGKLYNVQNDSEHTIGSCNSIRYSKFGNKSERKPAYSSLIQRKMKEHCFYDNDEKEQVEDLHSSEQVSKEVVDENSENNIDLYLRRLPGESLKRNFDESISQDDNEFEQAQLERNSNRINNLMSQNILYSDDNSKYMQKFNEILDSKR